jgi:hypothetical protein
VDLATTNANLSSTPGLLNRFFGKCLNMATRCKLVSENHFTFRYPNHKDAPVMASKKRNVKPIREGYSRGDDD